MATDVTALYHYTSISGLKGIIENGCLHASNVRYMNDAKEFFFGPDYFSKVLPHPAFFRQELPDINKKSLIDHFVELLFVQALQNFKRDSRELAADYFVISFSKNPDVLSQWRGYGKENAGYCIKFNYQKLYYPSDNLDGLIVDVKYIDPDDISLAKETLDAVKKDAPEWFKSMPWLQSNDVKEYAKMLKKLAELEATDWTELALELSEFLDEERDYPKKVDMDDDHPAWYTAIHTYLFFVVRQTISSIGFGWKHHSFSEEEEYRLVTQRDHDLLARLGKRGLKFKEGKTFLVPYIEIPYDFKNNPIIEEVIVGPCPHPAEAVSSVQQFLALHLNNKVPVVESKVPYRFL